MASTKEMYATSRTLPDWTTVAMADRKADILGDPFLSGLVAMSTRRENLVTGKQKRNKNGRHGIAGYVIVQQCSTICLRALSRTCTGTRFLIRASVTLCAITFSFAVTKMAKRSFVRSIVDSMDTSAKIADRLRTGRLGPYGGTHRLSRTTP
jgi:hypothetical protein